VDQTCRYINRLVLFSFFVFVFSEIILFVNRIIIDGWKVTKIHSKKVTSIHLKTAHNINILKRD